jgi:hypothetical protein
VCCAAAILAAAARPAAAVGTTSYVTSVASAGRFALATTREAAPLFLDSNDHAGVLRVAKQLQADIGRVTGHEPRLGLGDAPAGQEVVLIGTLGKSPLIDSLVESKKLDVSDVAGKWEAFVAQVVEQPMQGVDRALVIAGSDKRGTIYGMYDLSAQIGVSPWYWWADVPVKQQSALYALPGRFTLGEPAVKYRGIFINDEAPALSGWMAEKFGGHNHKLYDHVFELILRLRGNYLWPAMWGRSIYEDDPRSPELAEEYGVVIATSHHEPMMRAHVDWERNGEGAWNYDTNEAKLREFWTEGIRRMGDNESVITVGMRGDGDEPMSESANIALLERIVADQRKIIGEVTGKDPAQVPQVWALYKEVQEYYDKGMRVPDDVTLLLCDDNWGNIRKLPKRGDAPRAGGYGIYYHFDYVGGPRNYKWLNTNQISRVWEQMHLAYEYGADRLWIVNVGDVKPMEFPIEFFLDYAWDPAAWPADRLDEYTRQWAAEQFGAEHAAAIADVLSKYTRYNARRKPELLAPETYSLDDYREAETIVADYNRLLDEAERIGAALPDDYRDAYFQIVLHPVKACANLNELYLTVAKNRLYAQQGRAATNDLAKHARELFARDAEISRYYNHELAGGKWSHMMDQTHIGYTYWQEPRQNTLPKVEEIALPADASLGVAVEGSNQCWPDDIREDDSREDDSSELVLPEFNAVDNDRHFVEVFNRGQSPCDYTVAAGAPWLRVELDPASGEDSGKLEKQQRLWVSVDWASLPPGIQRAPLVISGPDGKQVSIAAIANNNAASLGNFRGFVDTSGYASLEAEHFSNAVDAAPIHWLRIPGLGRTLSGMTPVPVTSESQTPGGAGPRLEYHLYSPRSGPVRVQAFVAPTLNFHNDQGLRYAISFDDQPPQIVNIHAGENLQVWEKWVADNANVTTSEHQLDQPGKHVLKFWMVDPGIVLEKLVVDTGGLKPSYLGPPESARWPAAGNQ